MVLFAARQSGGRRRGRCDEIRDECCHLQLAADMQVCFVMVVSSPSLFINAHRLRCLMRLHAGAASYLRTNQAVTARRQGSQTTPAV